MTDATIKKIFTALAEIKMDLKLLKDRAKKR